MDRKGGRHADKAQVLKLRDANFREARVEVVGDFSRLLRQLGPTLEAPPIMRRSGEWRTGEEA